MRRLSSIVAALSVIVLAPWAAHGQTNGAFTGRITDNTGGVLPGATVEAASPALIEGSRVTISDGAGRYTLVDLRPGDYTLTFTLPGFSTVIREGLDLPAGFTMTIDGELSIGGLEETVTVSGAAPVVDVRTNARAEVLDRATLDAIPTGHNLQSTAQLIVGVKLNRPEVGLTTAAQQTFMAVHGMSPSQTTVRVDGQVVNSLNLDGAGQAYHNHLASQELVYETAGVSAETSGGGVRVNMIPREGGNAFSGQGYLGGSIDRWQADGLESLSPRTVERGVAGTEGIDFLYDLNVGQGGALVRDTLWFFGSFRNMQIDKKVTNSFHRETDVAPRFFDPAPVRLDGRDGRPRVPGIDENTVTNALLRLTYRAGAVNKFSAYLDRVFKDRHSTHDAFTDVATAARRLRGVLYYTSTAKWTATLNSRVLFEAGHSATVSKGIRADQDGGPSTAPRPAGVRYCAATPCYPDDPRQYGAALDPWYRTTMRYDADTRYRDRYHLGHRRFRNLRRNYSASLSYVTGLHTAKVGVTHSSGTRLRSYNANGDLDRAQYRSGVPDEVQVSNRPLDFGFDYGRDLGIYAQDAWTLDRLTVNLGLRWEQMVGHVPETDRVQGRFVPAATFPRMAGLPDWKDVAPRLGAAYDLFGDATTALRVSWGRYNAANTYTYAEWFHPAGRQSDRRDWRDCALAPSIHADGVVRCATRDELAAIGFDPEIAFGARGGTHVGGPRGDYGTNGDDYVQDWEIGLATVQDFGGRASRPVEDPDGVERAWVGVFSAGVQREILPGLSAGFTWYRRDSHDTIRRVNRALGFADYTPLTIENPCAANPRAGFIGCSSRGIAAEPTLQVWNLDPARRGVTDWVVRNTTSDDDLYAEVYNGFESSFNARLPNGARLFGGWTFERNVSTRCDVPHDPNRQLFCDARDYSIPFLHEFKLSGSVPLPGGIQISGSAQLYPAQEAVAGGSLAWGGTHQGGALEGARPYNGNIDYVVPSSVFADQGHVRTQSFSVPLMPPGALFYDRLTQVDLSVRRTFALPNGMRWELQADIYNLIDAQPILNGNNAFGTNGASLGSASSTIQGRFLQVGSHIHW